MEATELTRAERIFEQGLQQGEQRGSLLGMREAIRQLLRARFGAVSPELESALMGMTREEELTAFIGRVVVARDTAGDTGAVIGLALGQLPAAAHPSTVSATVRETSGIPSRLRPVKRRARTTPRDRAAREEARELLSPSPLNDAAIDTEDEDDAPVFAAHVLAVN